MPKDDSDVDLRGSMPREVADVLDAFSQARRIPRIDLVNRILKNWAIDRVREATLLQRITRGNPPLLDTSPGDLE